VKLRRLLPGSLTADGCVYDVDGEVCCSGTCFIPGLVRVTGPRRQGRVDALNAAGWRILRDATRWPGILPCEGAICIIRSDV